MGGGDTSYVVERQKITVRLSGGKPKMTLKSRKGNVITHKNNGKSVRFFKKQLLKKIRFQENSSHSNIGDELEIGSDKGKENK